MPHLVYNGIDPVWLLKALGDTHWSLLRNVTSSHRGDKRLYASFFATEINLGSGQDFFKENSVVNVNSNLYRFNNGIYRSIHDIESTETAGSVILDSIFVRKDYDKGVLVKDEPDDQKIPCPNIEKTFLEDHSKLKRKFVKERPTQLNELMFSPASFFNGVKILYCANYLHLALLNEWIEYQDVLKPIKKINIFWFSNIQAGDKVFGNTIKNGNEYITTLIANDKVISYIKILR